MKKALIAIIVILVIAMVGGFIYYWYFYTKVTPLVIDENIPQNTGFSPINRPVKNTPAISTTTVIQATTTNEILNNDGVYKAPKLRQLSESPVSVVSASSTATTSIVRFVDRGTGHVYEARNTSSEIEKISNTTLPKIYSGYANKNGSAFVMQYLKDETDIITNFYAELRSTGTSTTETKYELKGKYLSPDIKQFAVSPLGDKVFTWNIEGNNGVGYVSSFDEKTRVKIIDTPINLATIDWPEVNTLILNTKASGISSGFIYAINTKDGSMRSVLGGIKGLTGKMSRDTNKLIYSYKVQNTFGTSLLNLKDNSSQETIFRTLSEKCVWSTLRKNELYCAVPTEIPDAMYPDDWYKGKVSFTDQIWYLDTNTGEVHLVANLIKLSNQLIDATNLTLDPKENTLYFINKRDLNLWALDLNQ